MTPNEWWGSAVTYACRHDDHGACPAAAACGCSCHAQLTFGDAA